MSALPPEQMRAMRENADRAQRPMGSLADRWEELHRQADQLAQLAHLSPEQTGGEISRFPALLAGATQWQRDLAWQAVEDIDAIMQPGLTALRTITARGQDAQAPALALWREFHAARDAVLEVVRSHEETADAA